MALMDPKKQEILMPYLCRVEQIASNLYEKAKDFYDKDPPELSYKELAGYERDFLLAETKRKLVEAGFEVLL